MTNQTRKSIENQLFLLLNELRGNGVNFDTFGPIMLAMLTLRYAEMRNAFSELKPDVTGTQLDEAISVLSTLWPYDQKLLAIFIENSSDADLLKSRCECPKELIATLRTLNSIAFENINDSGQMEQVFGDLFEFLLFQLSEMNRKTGGGAYTPRAIVSLMTEIMKPQPGEDAYDPTCGSGGFLLSAWRYAQEHDGGKDLHIYGQEINLITSCIARMNIVVHGIKTAEIACGSALVTDNARQRHQFDVVMANPPFSLSSWQQDKNSDYTESEMYKFGIPPKSNADYAFIQQVIYSMKKTGRAAMIVASGVLFRGGIESAIRKRIVEEKYIETVIALPSNIFYGTAIAAYILLLRGGRSANEILFIDSTKDYINAEGRNVYDPSAIRRIVEACESRASVIGKSRLVSFDEIKNNSFNLEVSRYVQEEAKEENTPLSELFEKQKTLESKLQKLQSCMHQHYKHT